MGDGIQKTHGYQYLWVFTHLAPYIEAHVEVAAVCLHIHMHIMSHTHMTQLLLDKISGISTYYI